MLRRPALTLLFGRPAHRGCWLWFSFLFKDCQECEIMLPLWDRAGGPVGGGGGWRLNLHMNRTGQDRSDEWGPGWL